MKSLKFHDFSKTKNIRQEVLEKNVYKIIQIYVRFQRIFVHKVHKITKSNNFYRRYLKKFVTKKEVNDFWP